MKKCTICKNEKNDVGPKPVGVAESNDVRLQSPNDALRMMIICNDCLNRMTEKEK